MAFLRSAAPITAAACLALLSAAGCQAILGIDDTSFVPGGDGSTGDGGPIGDGSGDDGTIGDGSVGDGATNDATAPSLLSFAPSRVLVHQGETVDVTVTLARGSFTGAAMIALASVGDAGVTDDGGSDGGGADGVGVPSLTIPAGQTTGTLHVSAGASASVGVSALAFTVTTDALGSASLPLLVAGAPGTVDPTFALGGIATDVGGGTAYAVAIGADDDVWAAGENGNWLVRHYFADGSTDTATNATMASKLASAGTVQYIAVRGTDLVAGGDNGATEAIFRKITTSGAVDSSFGASGTFSLLKGTGGIFASEARGLAFGPTGEVLLAVHNESQDEDSVYRFHKGVTKPDEYDYGIAVIPSGVVGASTGDFFVSGDYLAPDGGTIFFAQRLTSSFGDGGTALAGSPSAEIQTRGLTLTPGNGIAIGATVGTTSGESTGSFASFATPSLAPELHITDDPTGTSDEGFTAIASQADSKLLATGKGGGSMTNTYVQRFLTDGGVDKTFGGSTSGKYTVGQSGFGAETFFYGVAVDGWGRIVAVGKNTVNGFYVTRIWP